MVTGSATGDSVTQLKDKLGSTQSQLNSNRQHEQSLADRVSQLNSQVSEMSSQLQLIQSREADAHDRLIGYDQRLAVVRAEITRELHHLKHVHHVLAHARRALAAELVNQYEQPQQTLVSVLVSSKGFQQLLDTLQYLTMARRQEQRIITAARVARSRADAAETRLKVLQRGDASAAGDAQTQTDALAGMNALLSSEQSALSDERAAQSTALAASQAKGTRLQAAMATIRKQEQAAIVAEQTIKVPTNTDPSDSTTGTSENSTGTGQSTTGTPDQSDTGTSDSSPSMGSAGSDTGGGGLGAGGLDATDGWAIPYKIVLCESGGQNLPPNGAGASGYYQIMPATWRDFGGSGAAAYLAPKSEQDAVASRIWNGGAGASNWACSAITGIT